MTNISDVDAVKIEDTNVRSSFFESFCVSLVLLTMFLVYPGKTVSYSQWYVHFFSFGTAGLLAFGACMMNPKSFFAALGKLPKEYLISFGVIGLLALYHTLKNVSSYSIENILYMFAFAFLPLFGYVFRDALMRLMPYFLSLLWVANIVLSYIEIYKYKTIPFGIPQNVNWNASLLVVTTAFFIFLIFRIFKSSRFLAALLSGIIFIIFIIPFLKCDSRGAYLGLAVAVIVMMLLKMKRSSRKIAVYAILATGLITSMLLIVSFKDNIAYIIKNDERPFFAKAAIEMIADEPFAGCGAPSFEQEYLKYRTADYFRLRLCADRTEHPHNDILYVAATSGIVGLAAYLFIMLGGVVAFMKRRRDETDVETKILFGLFIMMCVHAQFDLVFFRVPTSLIAYIISGMLLALSVRKEEDMKKAVSPSLMIRRTTAFAGAAVLICAILFALLNLNSWHNDYTLKHLKNSDAMISDVYSASLKNLKESNGNPEIFYNSLFVFAVIPLDADDANEILSLAEKYRTVTPDYGHTNRLMAEIAIKTNRIDEAEKYLLREVELYPLMTIPLRKLATFYHENGMNDKIPTVINRLDEVMKIQNIKPSQLEEIYVNPQYDLRPWDMTNPPRKISSTAQQGADYSVD